MGSATLVVGTIPNGIAVTIDPDSINNLQSMRVQTVIASIDASATVTPGNYIIDVELQKDSTILDTMQLNITITSKETTSTKTDNGTAPGIPILGVIMILGIITVFRRKRR